MLINRSIFPQAYVPPSPSAKSISYTGRCSFVLQYLSPFIAAGSGLAELISSPAVGLRKSLGANLYRTHQNDIELPSKYAAAPELAPQVMGIAFY
jgi:hypothetical protein